MRSRPGIGAIASALIGVALVLFAYYALRTPFFMQPLQGEEGIFADMIARSPPGPDYVLAARIHGEDVRMNPLHPALLYEAYTKLGAALRLLSGPNFAPSDVWARFAHSLFLAALFAALAARAAQARGGRLLALGGLGLASIGAPMAVIASIFLQTDTSTGVLLAGLLGLALADGEDAPTLAPLVACFALSAVGKQEWSMGVLAGLIGAELVATWRLGRSRIAARFLLLATGALLLGQIASYLLQPENYLGGFAVMSHVLSAGKNPGSHSKIVWMWQLISPGLFVPLGVGAILAATARPERLRAELRAITVAWALFIPYAFSDWNPSARYFAPAWGAALALVVVQISRRAVGARSGAAVLLAGTMLAVYHYTALDRIRIQRLSLTEVMFQPYDGVIDIEKVIDAVAVSRHCVPRLNTGFIWNSRHDFVGQSIGYDLEEAIIVDRGARACPPPVIL